uniref:Glucosamine 6-phosphate N-acetyltransferase (Phosphoglucosamine transacetylase)) n=1 Tax=Ganoderma boninense TaxID=34458 RepID=A0A5K1K4V9_9APHY|nr:Glucosamine 6-phosphate N-acetyltransferase (EC (Phosphoglucosamine acetylase) (Phosphoglucosamine transacetylase) [Ganoderma boninense]
MQQTKRYTTKDPPAQNARRSRTSSNRRVTVHQLALHLPQACSQSNSLSAFITALENASPGWCRSLMDSALPQSESGSGSSEAANLAPPSDSSYGSLGSRPDDSGSASTDSLQCNLLEILDELEELAAVVRCLPIPRPRTMNLDEVASAFLPPAMSTPASERRHHTMPAAPSYSSSLVQLRGRGSTPTVLSEFSFEEVSPERSLSPDTASALRYNSDPNQPAIDNLVYHPKLARTLGLQSLPSWGPPEASPRTPSPQQPYSPPTSSWSGSQSNRSPLEATPPLPPKTPEKGRQTPFKTPKSLRFTSLFRRRPSTPAVIDNLAAAQDPRSGGSPVPRIGCGAVSELGVLALGSANGSPASKTSSRFSPILGDSPSTNAPPNPNTRQRKLDSFLFM